MNKYSFANMKIGDIFVRVDNGQLLKFVGKEKLIRWEREEGTLYDFIELDTKQPWSQNKSWVMKNLKPAPKAAKVLYEAK